MFQQFKPQLGDLRARQEKDSLSSRTITLCTVPQSILQITTRDHTIIKLFKTINQKLNLSINFRRVNKSKPVRRNLKERILLH